MASLTERSTLTRAKFVLRPAQSDLRVRLLAAALGLIGAGVLAYGVLTPWLSTYGGMLSQSGWGTRNGSILFALAVAAGCLALLQPLRSSSMLRWVLALTGFAAAGYAGYLLIQLYSVTQQLDGMTLASKGRGLYFAAAGGALVFATIFLPLPAKDSVDTDGQRSHHTAVSTTGSTRLVPAVLRPLGSWLRYPAAGLGIVAGLAHVPVTPAHLQEAPYIGTLFIVFTTVSLLSSTLLLISDSPAAWTVLAGSCLLAVAAFVISRTLGLPLMADDIGHWNDPLGIVSVATESAVVLLGAVALTRSRPGLIGMSGR
jgi:hypothetical protein